MTWEPSIDLNTLKQNNRQTTVIHGKKILLIWHEEQIHAIDAQCPHLKMPLAKGQITEQCEIVCPFHKSTFNLKTGTPTCWASWPPVLGPLLGKLSKPKGLKIYPTRVEDGNILIEV